MKPRILILSFSNIQTDPRVQRQIILLKEKFDVTVAGFCSENILEVSVISIPGFNKKFFFQVKKAVLLLSKSFESFYYNLAPVVALRKICSEKKFDIILANDVDSLPVAFDIAKGAPVVLDAHEYSPKEFSNWKWRLFFAPYKQWLCETYLPRVHGMSTVCQGIAEEYGRNFGVRCTVVTNAATYHDLQPSPLKEGRIRLIHHGASIRERQLERMVDMMDLLDDRFTLDLMLVPHEPKYLDMLRRRAGRNHRIRFVDPVPFDMIVKKLNEYDIGIYILPFSNFNNRYALPNKFFEFVQARLGIAIGPSPEMMRLVQEHELGLVAKDFAPESMAEVLGKLTPDQIARFKSNADRAAKLLSAESAGAEWLRLIENAMKN